MKSARMLGIVGVAVCVVLAVLAGPAAGTTYYVDPNGSDDANGLRWDTAFGTIGKGITSSSGGDVVEVNEGTYNEAINFSGKAITLRSTDPNDPNVVAATVIDGTGHYHVVQCVSSEGPNTILEGFTITGGNANGSGSNGYGGGMYNYNSSPTVTDCNFTGNWAKYGGGMLNDNSAPNLTDCAFTNNTSANYGGGMENTGNSSPTVTNCTFTGNSAADNGGGIFNNGSSPTILNCTFISNQADLYHGGGMENYVNSNPTVTNCTFNRNSANNSGGGMYNNANSNPTVTNCTFSKNSAQYGGGMYCENSSPTVTSCTFSRNQADLWGGGMRNYNGSSPTVTNCTFSDNTADEIGGGISNNDSSSPTVTNCTFIGNKAVSSSGGGMWNTNNSSPTVTNCTFSGNSAGVGGGGMRNNSSSPIVTNCILWGNSPDEIYDDGGSSTTVTYSDVLGGYSGTGNIDANPLFVNAGADNLRLRACSLCVDAGDNNSVPPDSSDLDGDGNTTEPIPFDLGSNPRFVDDEGVDDTGVGDEDPNIVDMGAYERQEKTLSDSVHNLTWNLNYCSIQAAIDDANDGDLIEVDPGTYDSIDFNDVNITVYSTDGPSVTFIDADGYGTAVTCKGGQGPSTLLEGFTITGGNATTNGGGMYCEDSSPTVKNCTFSENSADVDGGGMYCEDSSPTVKNCTFSENSADVDGGGMYNNNSSPTVTNCTFSGNSAINWSGSGMYNRYTSNPTVTNCTFSGNTAKYVGGGICNNDNSSPTVTNCTFIGNQAVDSSGGGMWNNYSSPTVTNCTFTGNLAGVYKGGGMRNNNSSPIVTNCILWGNSPDEIFDYYSSGAIVTYCDIAGGYSGTGNIDANPWFVNRPAGDLRLRACSPCVDAGDNSVVTEPNDLGGDPRKADDAGVDDTGVGDEDPNIVDMGAYERQEDTLLFNVRNIYRDVNYCSIQAAIDDANDGDEIEVGPGTYNPIDFNEVNNIRVYSSQGPSVTFIDAGGYGNAVICKGGQGPSTVLEGFTITGGSAQYGGGMYCLDSSPTVKNCTFSGNSSTHGGGMYNAFSYPTVTNCRFSGNTAYRGGGMRNNNSSPVVTNCTFIGNTAEYVGGGICNNSSSDPNVTNCTFIGNQAGNSSGGGMWNNYSSPTVTNCTFIGNSAGVEGGGMRNNNSSPVVTNCILWGNSPDEIYDYSSSAIVTYSDVQGGYSGTGNIDANPLFVNAARDDFRLASYLSPCVDAGENGVVTEPNDLAGNPRVVDGDCNTTEVVDLGAYEFNVGVVRNLRLNCSYLTIQAAIDDANNGDVIEVGPGTYDSIDFNDLNIKVYSTDGPSVTFIDAAGYGTAVICKGGQGPSTVLEGFTITGGNDPCGGGMYCENSSPTVTGCIFTGNSARYGGGMYNRTASPTLINCFFNANTANLVGGAILNEQNSEPNLTNCSFSGNDANDGGGIYNIASSPTFTNCILWGDEPNEIVDDPCSTSVVTYSDVQGGWGGQGNIDQNPLLRNVTEGDLSLAPWSPCVDTGNSDVVAPNAVDITGLPRLVDGDCNTTVIVDMGAREFGHTYGGDFDSSCFTNMVDFAFLAWAWLATPVSANWDPVCDISTPADGLIDNKDLKVFAGNWLRKIDPPITCDANRLKDEFGLDAVCAGAILSAAPCGYSPNDVAHALHDVGYSAAGTYQALTQVCGLTDGFPIEQLLYSLGYPPEEYLESTALSFVEKFAPVLYFDEDYRGLPMSAQVYFETMMSPRTNYPGPGLIKWETPWSGPCGKPGVEYIDGRDEDDTCGMTNNAFSTLENGEIPTYYKVISDIDSSEPTGSKGRLRIAYWWFYGFQYFCNSSVRKSGEHHGDWEHIIVTTDPNRTRADAVTYYFHDSSYTRLSGGFKTEPNDPQGRPVVYVGKLGHGNYHSNEPSCLAYWGGGTYRCCRYADCRTPDVNSMWYNTYDNLVSLRGSEPWMLADRIWSVYEYYGVEYTIAGGPHTWRWGPHISYCHIWEEVFGWCADWHHELACQTHPTVHYPMDWDMASCGGKEGCGTDECIIDDWWWPSPDYPVPIYYDEGWPWD